MRHFIKMKTFSLKDRKYRLPICRSFLLFFFIALWWLFCGISIDKYGNKLSGLSAVDQPLSMPVYAPVNKSRAVVSYVVKRGDTFLDILSGYCISNTTAINCCRLLRSTGLSSLIPGDSLILSKNSNGLMSEFSLLHKLNCWYTVKVDGADIKIEKRNVEKSSLRCMVKGVLSSSLSENMNEMGVDDACVSKFADIFAWDINFFVDPQVGDSFEILFEKKYAAGRFTGYGDILAAKYINNGKIFEAIGIKNDSESISYYTPNGASLQKQFLKAPLHFTHISSGFSLHRMHPVLGIIRPHLGIDYAAPSGTPVYAAADGIISCAAFSNGFGNLVRIRHGTSYETSYGHLKSFARSIRCGKRVCQGDLIGFVGQTGLATGPHLDYRMTKDRQLVNPLKISMPPGKNIPEEKARQFELLKHEYMTILDIRLKNQTGFFILDINGIKPSYSAYMIARR